MLTKKQLKQIEEMIRKRFLAFRFENLGERSLTPDEIDQLKRAGILRSSVRNFSGDAYALGRIINQVGATSAASLGYDEVKKIATKMPTTSVEEKAIEFANDHAGEYIQGIADDMIRDIRAGAARSTEDALRAVQDGVKNAIKDRKTISELKTTLYGRIDNRFRDWQRVAHTEMTAAIQRGVYNDIRESSSKGADQLVFKRPSPDACSHCKRMYLEEDGITPRIFKMSELEDSNIGLRVADWKPTIGPVHPWCQCQLQVVPDGFEFETTKEGKAELVFTGRTAKISLRKSLNNVVLSDEDSDCTCDY
jgi:hypothetical protein